MYVCCNFNTQTVLWVEIVLAWSDAQMDFFQEDFSAANQMHPPFSYANAFMWFAEKQSTPT